ncbi:hypothetical protein [Brachybacterium sp. FME24]|nr:hypothetical protein [Brachybacterium sp. FME24]
MESRSRRMGMQRPDCLASGEVVRHHERSLDALNSVEEALERYW